MKSADIDKLKRVIHVWASNLDYGIKVYFFGSRLNGMATKESDLDIAIEFLGPRDIDPRLLWNELADEWQDYLSEVTGLIVDLHLYVRGRETYVELSIGKLSQVLFEPGETRN